MIDDNNFGTLVPGGFKRSLADDQKSVAAEIQFQKVPPTRKRRRVTRVHRLKQVATRRKQVKGRKGDNPTLRLDVPPYATLPRFTEWLQGWESVQNEIETEAARRRFAWNQLVRAKIIGDLETTVAFELRKFSAALDRLRRTVGEFHRPR